VLVESVEVDIGEQGADDPALRRAAQRGLESPILAISGLEHVLDQAKEAVVADLLAEDRQQDPVVDVVEAPFDISLDEPLRALPGPGDVLQCGVTSQAGSKSVGVDAELRLEVGLQDGAHHLLQQLVAPRRDAERPHLPVGLGDEDASDRGPSIAFMANLFDERLDLLRGHPVHGIVRHPPGEGSGVSRDPTVSLQVEIRVVEPSIDVLQVESVPASFVDDGQRRFGISHVANLPSWLSTYLARFAMWTAFPPSDYYRASVTMRPAPTGPLTL